jgi:hypothetical protein
MMAFMNGDQTGTGAARIQDSDEMSNKTSVVPSAEGPSIHEEKDELTVEGLENSDGAATYNSNLAACRD